MLSQICFRLIRDNFWHGQYGNFSVVVDKSNGFVNATKLCSDGGKRFHHWGESKMAKELIKTLQQWNCDLALDDEHTREPWSVASYHPVSDVLKYVSTTNVTDDDKAISGTYVHPLLIPHIACWVSPEFALKASSIINFFLVEEWKCCWQAAELVLNQHAQMLEDQNMYLEAVNDNLQLNIQQLENAVEVQNAVVEVKKEVVNKLDEKVCDKVRERQVWSSTHSFILLKLHSEKTEHGFYAIRCQGKRVGGAIKKLRTKFPSAEVIYQQRKVPNSVNLYTRIKEQKAVCHKHNYCTPTGTQQELVYLLNSLCGTTYPPSNPTPLNSTVDLG